MRCTFSHYPKDRSIFNVLRRRISQRVVVTVQFGNEEQFIIKRNRLHDHLLLLYPDEHRDMELHPKGKPLLVRDLMQPFEASFSSVGEAKAFENQCYAALHEFKRVLDFNGENLHGARTIEI